MSKTFRLLAGLALVSALVVVAPQAYAEVEPGGWKPASPGFKVQQKGCGKVSGMTFQLTCSNGSGEQRAERRYDTYTGGTHQFEGYFKVTSMGGTRISLKQTFNDTDGGARPYFMLAVERGGRLYAVHGGDTLSNAGTVGATVRVNTVHQVGKE